MDGEIVTVDRIVINGWEQIKRSTKRKVDRIMESGEEMQTIDLQRSTAGNRFKTRRGKINGRANRLKNERER